MRACPRPSVDFFVGRKAEASRGAVQGAGTCTRPGGATPARKQNPLAKRVYCGDLHSPVRVSIVKLSVCVARVRPATSAQGRSTDPAAFGQKLRPRGPTTALNSDRPDAKKTAHKQHPSTRLGGRLSVTDRPRRPFGAGPDGLLTTNIHAKPSLTSGLNILVRAYFPTSLILGERREKKAREAIVKGRSSGGYGARWGGIRGLRG